MLARARSNEEVILYLDGLEIQRFRDSERYAVSLSDERILRLFQDNQVGGEDVFASNGTVDVIRIYSGVLR